jgi:putative NADH-flavin reductase
MRIAIYGATGMIGSRLAAEAVARGHEVVGVTRSGGELPAGVSPVRGDAGDAAVAEGVADAADVVFSAIGPSRTGGEPREYLDQMRNLVETLGGRRLLVIGGAGSLLVDGRRLVDDPEFPAAWKTEALIVTEALDYFRGLGDEVNWTFISPAPMITPGERTGVYTLGLDSPAGETVSAEDFAVALIDEVEKPAHERRRFTLAN